MAKDAFQKLGKVLKDRKLFMKTKKRVLECYVKFTFLYGSECWTLSPCLEKLLRCSSTEEC